MTTREYMTALLRAIRLKRPEDALGYYAWLRDNGAARERIIENLIAAALHDNLNIGVMEEALLAKTDVNADLKKLVIALASSQKYWSCEAGRSLLMVICAAREHVDLRDYSDAELLERTGAAMEVPRRFFESLQLGLEILQRRANFSRSPWPALVDRLERRVDGTAVPVWLVAQLRVKRSDDPVIESLLFKILAWLADGVWGQEMDLVPPDVEFRVATQQSAIRLQDWAVASDRRFGSGWDSYANMALMVEQHGRLDVDDDGVLFRTQNGQWRPVIKQEAGLYLVQSERRPRHFYEVNLANLSCTCEDWVRRQHECKHIGWARVEVEKHLPFELVG